MDYEILYSDENMSVLLPAYLSDSVSDSDSELENERENSQNGELNQDSDNNNSNDYSDILLNEDVIIANQESLMLQIDNLNSNVCTMNNNLLYLVGINGLILLLSLLQVFYRIFVNTLCLGKA